MYKKGQLSIINIISFIILVILGVVTTPIMLALSNGLVTDNNITGMNAVIINSLVAIFWLGIIATFWMYVTPVRQMQQY
jgi:hypothetical protein